MPHEMEEEEAPEEAVDDKGPPLEGHVRDSFDALGLSKEIVTTCEDVGYEKPTDIQQRAIPLVMGGQDIIGQAKTGTGKTAAFALPIIQRMDVSKGGPTAIVLEPTRELANQVTGEFKRLSVHRDDFYELAVYGGAAIGPQVRSLERGVTVVVGTPGRLMDLMRREELSLDGVKVMVLDEADRMLDMGFIGDIEWILERTPDSRQTLLFSATMLEDVRILANKYMKDPVYIRVSTDDDLTVEATEQVYYRVGRRNKMWALSKLLDEDKPELTIVFCNTKVAVDMVGRRLRELDYNVGELHGDMRQASREKILDRFRKGELKILVASDVAARGLDIEETSMVVNYDIPEDPEGYVHRIGRTSRMGRKGKAVTFVTTQELHLLEAVERWASTIVELNALPESSKRDRLRYVTDFDELANRYGMVTFELDVGAKDGVKLLDVLEIVRRQTRLPEHHIGHIEIGEEKSTVEIDKWSAGQALGDLKRTRFKGRKVWVDIIEPDLLTERRKRDTPPGIYDMPSI